MTERPRFLKYLFRTDIPYPTPPPANRAIRYFPETDTSHSMRFRLIVKPEIPPNAPAQIHRFRRLLLPCMASRCYRKPHNKMINTVYIRKSFSQNQVHNILHEISLGTCFPSVSNIFLICSVTHPKWQNCKATQSMPFWHRNRLAHAVTGQRRRIQSG